MRLKSATYKKPKMETSLVRRLECDNVRLRRSRWTEFLRTTGGERTRDPRPTSPVLVRFPPAESRSEGKMLHAGGWEG